MMLMSSYGHRAVSQYLQVENGVPLGTRSRSHRENKGMVQSVSQHLYRKSNPHVIYPFASKLKVLRIDDNPKVLSNVIKKKIGVMGGEKFMEYLGGLAQRVDR